MPNRKAVQVLATLLLLMLSSWALNAQENPAAARMRALNNALLGIHGQMQRATPNEAALLHSQAATVIEERAAALSALIEQDARQGLSFAFSPELLADLAEKFPQSASNLEQHGTWRGPVEYRIFDGADMKSHRSQVLMTVGQQKLELHFAGAEPANLKSGDVVEATGVVTGEAMAVSSTVIAPTTTSTSSTTSTPACSNTGVQKTAVILATYVGGSIPTNVTPQSVYDIFFGTTGHSLDGYWREASYGQTSASGDVFGWYTLPGSYSCTTTNQLSTDALAAASAAGANFQNYTRIFVVFPDFSPSCGFSGFSQVGCYSVNTPNGSVTASTSYIVAAYLGTQDGGVSLVTHEGGHQLGLGHASTVSFGTEPLGPVGSTGTLNEYGDWWSAMGTNQLSLYGAPHKSEILSWMVPGTNYQAVQGSGTYMLQPLETNPPGLQALKVQRGTGNNEWLWVEYRQPIGNYDSTLSNYPAFSEGFTGALIHFENATTGNHTRLLDFTRNDPNFYSPALAAGQTWTDPYTNLSLSVSSATSSGLTVSVNYGVAPCTHANPTLAVTPLNPSIFPGNSASYAVSVTNNDAAGCASSTFNLGSTQPSGWPTSFSASAVTLSPGQSASATMSKTGPVGTPPGTYAVNASAANGSFVASGTANVTVMAPPSLSVSVSVSGASFTNHQTVSLTAVVLNGPTPAAGASVTFTLTKADGSKVTQTVAANSTGTAVWSYKIGQRDPKGSYSAVAQATFSSQTATSNTATFTVQ